MMSSIDRTSMPCWANTSSSNFRLWPTFSTDLSSRIGFSAAIASASCDLVRGDAAREQAGAVACLLVASGT